MLFLNKILILTKLVFNQEIMTLDSNKNMDDIKPILILFFFYSPSTTFD